jgi:transcriptional regulator with XRE-family HTH domain
MQGFFSLPIYDSRMAAKKIESPLRALREAAGISLRELARQIGEDHSNVRFWETTGKIPRSDVLIPMAKALGVTVEELLGEPKAKRSSTPGGRVGQMFEAVSKLPRRQQQKIVDLLQPFVREQVGNHNRAA